MNLNRFAAGYVSGVVTAPAVYFIFRKPLLKHVVTPMAARTFMNEELNEKLTELVFIRLDAQELKKKHGKTIRQMKAQGHSVSEIADVLDLHVDAVKAILATKPD